MTRATAIPGGGARLNGPVTASSGKYHAGRTFGDRDIKTDAWLSTQTGTSIFDPVLCELAYRWFCPAGGQIIDPFAGGSVRGIVAALLGRNYWGCDLREEQVAANNAQGMAICPDRMPKWVTMDAMRAEPPAADFLFSCPPYGDLEEYSDDPADLSTMDYAEFVAAYRTIIARFAAKLRPDRFACFVVGDYRDTKTGNYRGFVAETITAFADAGLALYNDAVLVTAVASLPIRVGKQFAVGRKLGKTHQNVLVFVKGDGKRAADAVGPAECGEVPEA